MNVWRCTHCRLVRRWVAPTLATDYGLEYCRGCRSPQIFRLTDEPAEGEARKQDGIARATAHAASGVDAGWRLQANVVARRLASSGQEFTQDDITNEVGLPIVKNATGGLLSALARQGIIERVGDTKGSRDSQHRRRISVWRGVRTVQACTTCLAIGEAGNAGAMLRHHQEAHGA